MSLVRKAFVSWIVGIILSALLPSNTRIITSCGCTPSALSISNSFLWRKSASKTSAGSICRASTATIGISSPSSSRNKFALWVLSPLTYPKPVVAPTTKLSTPVGHPKTRRLSSASSFSSATAAGTSSALSASSIGQSQKSAPSPTPCCARLSSFSRPTIWAQLSPHSSKKPRKIPTSRQASGTGNCRT